MELMWLYSVCQCVLYMSVIGVSVRMCVGKGQRSGAGDGGSVSDCLRMCLGWAGAVGGVVAIPVSVLLNLRSPQCLYTCLTMVCCPLLVRQFTMFLLLLLTINSHLQYKLGERYAVLVSGPRALLAVLFSWVGSVLTAFAQFLSWNVLDTWGQSPGGGTAGLGLGGAPGPNWTTPFPPPKYPGPQDRSIIGQYLPYGGFLSKFYVEDQHNFTYAQIHGRHWGVCALDTVLSPDFLVYVYSVTAFLLPLLVLLALYLDLLCMAPKLAPDLSQGPKSQVARSRSLALSLCLLVLLCLPLHTSNALLLFSPGTLQPPWVPGLASLLFQLYGLVPPLLHTSSLHRDHALHTPRPPPPSSPPLSVSPGKHFAVALCSDARPCGICCPPWGVSKVKVCPEV
ncbi:adenosine receptor A2b-like [Conger conger]|uniref:adenosine receptor A2b-like n=1 Tax=Conger conger TaxID=82655 RepID=UPI002A5A8B8F|nr:adenosine receptor A2b-like [Conger conger]